MKDILSRANREVLEQVACANVLVAFDYDGTLSPIVDDPEEARIRPRTRELLEEVTKLYPTIIVSGRGQADVIKRVRGTGIREVIGNHGLEPWRRTEEFAAQVQKWLPSLHKKLGEHKGVVIEDKQFSLAIHYRQSREKKVAHAAILEAAQALEGVRLVGGKQVVNLLPEGAPHKGIALEAARERLACDTALYVGDDETDEDVFAMATPGRLLGIRVGKDIESRASFCIPDQEHIDALLQLLVELRAPDEKRAVTR